MQDQPTIAVCGNPNTGKSTVFNALTGLRQKVANFPGVTVDKRTGSCRIGQSDCQLIDVPGTYALSAHSLDEMIAVDVLLGRIQDVAAPDVILAVIDASNLRRNLFLLSQILEIGKPVVVALTMCDLAQRNGVTVDSASLHKQLGVPVVPVLASNGAGIEALRDALQSALTGKTAQIKPVIPELWAAIRSLNPGHADHATPFELERAVIDQGFILERLAARGDETLIDALQQIRKDLAEHGPLPAMEARRRYRWADQVVAASSLSVAAKPARLMTYLEAVSGHPFWGLLLFFAVMAMVFQAVFSWTAPMMDAIDAVAGWLGDQISLMLPPGALTSLLVDGVLAGVGAVVIFLPQILVLFALIIILEDTGYMARAAFLMDRFMRACGLSGTSFIPMLSSFACAVPGIMATRVIPNHRDRIATILSAPFMTCSARLPVYALLIAAFVPARQVLGIFNLQGIVLFAMYMLGIAGGIFTAWWLKRTLLKGETPSFLMELPSYHYPNLKSVMIRMLERARIFLRRAGTVIFTVAVIVWALAYFPHSADIDQQFELAAASLDHSLEQSTIDQKLVDIEHQRAAAHLENSALGVIGHAIEPVFRPLGWDWKISAAVVASFPAREVVLAVLGTIYAVGDEVNETHPGLIDRIKNSRWRDGRLVFSLPVALGLMVFYAFCLQCIATVATMRRETNSWRWPILAWSYMTLFGYAGAYLTYQVAQGFSGVAG
jgi:ferrous iron transport protein B